VVEAHVKIHGVADMKAAFRRLPKEASKSLKEHTSVLAEDLAQLIHNSATGSSRQAAAVAKTVKARKDRFVAVQAGGNRRVTSQRRVSSGQGPTKAYMLLFGANFGASQLNQFRSHRGAGTDDYFFFSTVEENTPRIDSAWGQVVDDVADEWGRA
jgi:hypothetical protein